MEFFFEAGFSSTKTHTEELPNPSRRVWGCKIKHLKFRICLCVSVLELVS